MTDEKANRSEEWSKGKRTRHPYHMYDAIQGQPDAFVRVAGRNDAEAGRFAARAASCDRLFLVGTGTSSHAALIGEHIMRAYGGDLPVHAYQAFDFALYGPRLGAKDCVIGVSHRGNKDYTVRSLARAKDAGCLTALVTGEGNVATRPEADAVFVTVPQEISSAHTISYTASLAVLSTLAGHLGRRRTGARLIPESVLSERVPAAIRKALATERDMAGWAREHVGRRRIWIVGGGPSAWVAHEVALKIKEAAYLMAEGLAVETMLHGPFQCTDPKDVFVLVAPAGAAQARVIELAGMFTKIGAAYLVVGDGTGESMRPGAAGWCVVPEVPEPFTALVGLVPLQLLTYHLALECGTNPDVFRRDDPRFARALEPIKL